MLDNEVEQIIQQAVSLKHQGRIAEAIQIEESCLSQCKTSKSIHPSTLAMLYKSMAKLYYLNRNIDNARVCYSEALHRYMTCDLMEFQVCLFHLGCCSKQFIESDLAEVYYAGLDIGGLPPGAPGSPITIEKVEEVTSIGSEIFGDWMNSPAKLK